MKKVLYNERFYRVISNRYNEFEQYFEKILKQRPKYIDDSSKKFLQDYSKLFLFEKKREVYN